MPKLETITLIQGTKNNQVPIQTLAFSSSFRSRDSTYVRKSPDHIAQAKRMKADGHTGKDIAKYLGVIARRCIGT